MSEKFRGQLTAAKNWIFPPPDTIRLLHYFIDNLCNLQCPNCRVPNQSVGPRLNTDEQLETIQRLKRICTNSAQMTIVGGEPTLDPDFLASTIKTASDAGFVVSTVTNGTLLNETLITRLKQAGLSYLSISVDSNGSPKRNLDKALNNLDYAKRQGILPVVSSVITLDTGIEEYKTFADKIINNGFFLSLSICSPSMPNGRFSNASKENVPTLQQMEKLFPYLIRKKLMTGLVITNYIYFKTMLALTKQVEVGVTPRWHCTPNFRTKDQNGRGFLALDSDGYVGPCEEYRHEIKLLDMPEEELSLQLLNAKFIEKLKLCPGCTYNCYVDEESLKGFDPINVIREASTAFQVARVISHR